MPRTPRGRRVLAFSLVVAGITFPAHVRDATARAPLAPRERTDVPDALHSATLIEVGSSDPLGGDASAATDGDETTAWTGRAGESQWRLTFRLAHPVHIGLLRVHWGESATRGVPTRFHWEVPAATVGSPECPASSSGSRSGPGPRSPAFVDESGWVAVDGTDQAGPLWGDELAQPTRRSWFVDVDACALRLVIDATNAALPAVREVLALESARDVLRGGRASDDGAYPGFHADAAIDGEYGTRWAGAPGRTRWTWRVDLPAPETIDRIRLVLGYDATGRERPAGGRGYAVSWAPLRYAIEASDDGDHFFRVGSEPVRDDGVALPVRRRLVTLATPRTVVALRLVMTGATGADGRAEPDAVPVVREVAAYRAGDPRPILAPPWILSVNANPSAQSRLGPGGEAANDALHARFLQNRFSALIPALRAGDPLSLARGDPRRDWLAPQAGGRPVTFEGPSVDRAGEALESIEGDDPELDALWLARSSPPPIVVLSGSNDWDYAGETGSDPAAPLRWRWDPLRDARAGGMGQLASAVRNRVAPFLGFCGGAQLLALFEARRPGAPSDQDLRTIDEVLERTSGRPIRGFAPISDVDRAWPTDLYPRRAEVRLLHESPLFEDVAGPGRRGSTRALPEWHADAVRADAFARGRPLERFDLIAESAFCPSGAQSPCVPIPEAFRSRDRGWPIIGAQFHAEQRDFATAAPGDPPESVADPRLFLAGVYEDLVDAYVKYGP